MEAKPYNPDHVFRLHSSSLMEFEGDEAYLKYGRGEFPFLGLQQLWSLHGSVNWQLHMPTADQEPLSLAEAKLYIPGRASLQIPALGRVRDLRKVLKKCLNPNVCEENNLRKYINVCIWDLLNEKEIQKILQDLAEVEERELLEVFEELQNSLPSMALNICTLLLEIQDPISLSQYAEFSKRMNVFIESDLEEQDPKIMGFMKRRLAASRKIVKKGKKKTIVERSLYIEFLEKFNRSYYNEDAKALEKRRRENMRGIA
jgi:hypothetical protein